MRRPRCHYCERPVGHLWLRCPVCRTRLAPWYVLVALVALAALLLLAHFVSREAVTHLQR